MAYTRVRVPGRCEGAGELNMAHNQHDQLLFGYLTKLRRHLLACGACKGARKALDLNGMCNDGKLLTLSAADEFDHIIELRRKVHSAGQSCVYACPDISAHGQSYALTARPYEVTMIRDGLF